MTELKSPTAVLHEGPRALTDEQVIQIEESDLAAVRDVDIDGSTRATTSRASATGSATRGQKPRDGLHPRATRDLMSGPDPFGTSST